MKQNETVGGYSSNHWLSEPLWRQESVGSDGHSAIDRALNKTSLWWTEEEIRLIALLSAEEAWIKRWKEGTL